MRTWKMWAQDYPAAFWHIHTDPRVVALYGSSHPIVAVTVQETEGDDATNWGWLNTDSHFPCMIYPSELQRGMCFPYGIRAEVDKGRGEALAFVITTTEVTQ